MKKVLHHGLLRVCGFTLAVLTLLSGCSTGHAAVSSKAGSAIASQAASAAPKVLRFGQANSGEPLDMQVSTGSLSASIADEVTESLLRFDDKNKEQPVLLEEFPTVSADGTVYSFTLKKGIHFTDGSELHSSDVKFTFERMFTPATGAKSYAYFNMIVGAKAMLKGTASELSGFQTVDDYHFKITLEYPYAPFVENLGTSYADIFPKNACKTAGSNWGVNVLVGTGPYILKSNDQNTQAVLVKNKNYHGGKVNLDEIDIIFYSDSKTKLLAYENGDIDLCDLPADLLSQYSGSYAKQITTYHPLGTSFLSINLKNEYLKNEKVREAISLAINRADLVKYVLNGAGIPATSYLNNSIPGHDSSLGIYEYNPAKAKTLLSEAGYAGGVTIDGGEVRQSEKALVEAIQSYLAEVGIKLKFKVVDASTWSADRVGGKLPFTAITWNALYPDADFQAYNYFYSTNSVSKSVNYSNSKFDGLLDQARKESVADKRAALYRQADYILSRQDYACIPLYYPQSQFIAKPYVKKMAVGNLIYHFWNVDIDPVDKASEKP